MRLSHAEAQALVSARLDGPLDPVAERELNAHLATCESCRAFNASANRLASGLQNLPYLPASPAVTRAVLDHVSAPRTPWTWLTGAWSSSAVPTIAAVATAVIIVFIGTFTALRLLDTDDDPSQLPASTQTSNLAARPSEDDETEEPATEVPGGGEQTGESGEPATEAPGVSGQDAATEEQGPATETVTGDQPETAGAPTDELVEDSQPGEATEAPGPTSEPDDVTQAGEAGVVTESETAPVEETEAPATESGEDLDTIGPPSATREPADAPTSEPETPADGEDEGTGSDETSLFAVASPTGSGEPTESPTAVPTEEPTAEPTDEPTAVPTEEPTAIPTDVPTEVPTEAPTEIPTEEPTPIPTEIPTEEPTEIPTEAPTPTEEPTQEPTEEPTAEPTEEPTPTPTEVPTEEPTAIPTEIPTEEPTEEPTEVPTEVPTEAPTEEPTAIPTEIPTDVPTEAPTPTPEPEVTPTAIPIEPRDGQPVDATEAPGESTDDDEEGQAEIEQQPVETGAPDDAGDDGDDGGGDDAEVIGPPEGYGGADEDTPDQAATDEDETPVGDGTGEEQVIEPTDGEEAADDGEEEDEAGQESPEIIAESPDDDSDDDGSGQQAGQGGGLTLADAPVSTDIGAVPGDGDRLGLSADGELVFSVNPGRASLESQGYVADTSNVESGQVVRVCSPDGACVDASAGSAPGGQLDTPIAWLDGEVIYERQGGETDAIEYRAVRFVPGTLEVADDRLLGGGGADLEYFLRPYPVGGGLLVPTASSWLYVTTASMEVIDANPYGENLDLPRVYPGGNLIAYVTGGTLVVASLDAPGTALAELPFAGIDYDLSPNGDQVAVVADGGIEVMDLQGNVVASYPNDAGLALGGITWVTEGILFVDYSNGVIRILPI